MLCFVLAHLLENGSGFLIPGWQLAEVIVQMLADLVFGRRDKAETDAVADQPGRGPDAEGKAIENRVEHTGVAAQLADALLTPGQMIDLLIRSLLHRLAHLRQARRQCLPLVKRLGADFTGVVDAHQPGNMAGFTLAELRLGLQQCRRRARGLAAEREQRP